MERKSVTVRCPATTANLGSGFDCLGMALDIWNELTVSRSEKFEIVIEGEGADVLPKDETNLVVTGIKTAFEAAKKPVPTLSYKLLNRIPFARGLGSSSAAIVAGLIAGLVLAGHELPVTDSEQLLQLAAAIEGHPDNVAPAIYGGLQLGIHTSERWWTKSNLLLFFYFIFYILYFIFYDQFDLKEENGLFVLLIFFFKKKGISVPSGLQTILFVPDRTCETSEARALLKPTIDRADAIYNMGRTALLVSAFSNDSLDDLRYATEDKLHQPARSKLMPALYPLINAALNSGAHGAFLSGAGPTVLAITSGRKGDIYAQSGAERKEVLI